MPDLTRNQFLEGTLATAASAILRAKAPSIEPAKTPFNILLIVTDQERSWQTLPKGLSLPARLDVAARGTSFTNYHVNAIACGPARATLYTGQHIIDNGIFDNPGGGAGRPSLDPARSPTIGNLLRARGYRTAYKGKWHLSRINQSGITDYQRALSRFGFDEWQRGPDSYGKALEGFRADAGVIDDAIAWLGKRRLDRAGARPWLLAVNLFNPHDIMFFDATGRQHRDRLPNDDPMVGLPAHPLYAKDHQFDLPASFPDSLGAKPGAHAAFVEHSDLYYGPIPVADEASWRRYQNYYCNCLLDVDAQIGRLMTALKSNDQWERTVIVFTSDHGEMAGAHAMRNKGPMIYRENNCVPMVIVHPDVRGGVTSQAVAGSTDLVPTLLELAGAGADEIATRHSQLKGRSMAGSIVDHRSAGARRDGCLLFYSAVHASNPKAFRRRALGQPADPSLPGIADQIDFETRSFYRALFDGQYRFARYFSPAHHHTPTTWEHLVGANDLELYDETKDPLNVRNLAQEPHLHRDLILALNSRLNRLIASETSRDDGSHMPGDPALWSAH